MLKTLSTFIPQKDTKNVVNPVLDTEIHKSKFTSWSKVNYFTADSNV